MNKALDLIEVNKNANCIRVVLFLTDGRAEFSDSDHKKGKKKAKDLDVVVFTYALGDEAQTGVMRKLACDNRGLFYHVPDGGDLGDAMAGYFEYFAKAVPDAQKGENVPVRWIEYTDAWGGVEKLMAACTPVYAPVGEKDLEGVACMDMNVIIDLETLKAKEDWPQLQAAIDAESRQCVDLDISQTLIDDLRKQATPGCEDVCNLDKPCGGLAALVSLLLVFER